GCRRVAAPPLEDRHTGRGAGGRLGPFRRTGPAGPGLDCGPDPRGRADRAPAGALERARGGRADGDPGNRPRRGGEAPRKRARARGVRRAAGRRLRARGRARVEPPGRRESKIRPYTGGKWTRTAAARATRPGTPPPGAPPPP